MPFENVNLLMVTMIAVVWVITKSRIVRDDYLRFIYFCCLYLGVVYIPMCRHKKSEYQCDIRFFKVTTGSKTIALDWQLFLGSVSDLRYGFACGDLESLFPRALILLLL